MSFSDMLFTNTHSVEELVDIKKQKRVDKILLKVIRTVRNKGSIGGWIKPESNFKNDLKMTDKMIANVKRALTDYYHIDLFENKSLNTAKDIVNYIKINKPNEADSIYLIDASQTEEDTLDEVQLDNDMNDPNVMPRPTEEESEPPKPESENPGQIPDGPDPDKQPIIDTPKAQLEPTAEEEGDADIPEAAPIEIEEDPNVSVSTEAFTGMQQSKGKMVWTYYTREKEGIKGKILVVGAGPNSRYICQVFPTKEALISNQTKGSRAPHTAPYALGIPFNYIKKYLSKRGNYVVINERVKVPVAICIIDKIPMERYSKENLQASGEGLTIKPVEAKSWADVMGTL